MRSPTRNEFNSLRAFLYKLGEDTPVITRKVGCTGLHVMLDDGFMALDQLMKEYPQTFIHSIGPKLCVSK